MAGEVYNAGITRDASNDPLVPTPVSAEIIKELPKASAALSLCRRVPMSSKTARQPVLSVLPKAYWVNGDAGLKQTTNADWENVELVAEELAVIVPVPEAYFDDAQVPIWAEVRPLLAQAIGSALDSAIVFGTAKPVTWTSQAIVPGAIAAGNAAAQGAGGTMDIGVDVANMGKALAKDGFSMRGFASEPGLNWELVGARSDQGALIYQPGSIANGTPDTLYGRPLNEVENGSWDSTAAKLVGGDFTKAIVGVRQDISFKIFTEGVISDADGKVILNLMQQDSIAMRVVFRVGYALANPVTAVQPDKAQRFPFAVLQPPAGP